MRTAIYARISSDPDDQQMGVDRQQQRGQEVIQARGWTLAETFTDNDASGFANGKRPGFSALCDAIRAGGVEAVVVQHTDRIARNVATFLDFADLCRSHDVRLETWAGPVDTDSASGRFMSTVQASVDEHYSALLSEKGRAAHADIAARGEPNGGRRPFGYQRVTVDGVRTYTADPEELPIVVEIFERVAAGASLRSIATDLNERGLETAGGSAWRTARVRDVVGNPLYIGQRVHRGEVVGDGNWPPIVDRDLFERVAWRLSRPGRRSNTGALRSYWLAGGLTICGLCGSALRAAPLRGRRSYACLSKPGGASNGCGKIRIIADPFEDHIAVLILEALRDPKVTEAMARLRGTEGPAIASELTDIEDRREQLAEAFADGDIDRRQLVAATRKLDERSGELRSQLATTDSPITDLLGQDDLETLWDDADVPWKARVARALMTGINVQPAVQGRNYFDPDRLEIISAVG